jgi:hypothetical protein
MKPFNISAVLRHCAGAVVIAAMVLAGLPASPVSATVVARYVATTGTNSGSCTSSSAPCKTVTYAINQAGSGNIIHIAGGTYTENLIVSKDLSFEGAGVDVTILNGGGTGRVVQVNVYTVSFSGLTIRGGNSNTNDGGGIYNYGTLSLDEVKVTANVAADGGGIYSSGALTMNNSVVSGNHANTDSTSDGGGLFLNSSHPTSITNTTISGNIATYYSGGIHDQASGLLTLTNVTISGNKANIDGAMTNTGVAQTEVLSSTIANNNFSSGGTLGGISNYSAIIKFKNTIIANNTGGNCNLGGGSWTSLGHNLDSGNTCNFTQTGDLHDTDPKLGALASDSASWLPTMALLAGSPAIDAGTISGYPATDERGVSRPQGPQCDIGAYESVYHTITGNAGDAGVVLKYINGTTKTVPSGSNGHYSFSVPTKWTGTVTPSKTGITFNPASRTYTSLTANQTAQNYTDTVIFKSNGTYDGWILESAKGSGVGGSMDSTSTILPLGDSASNRQYRAILSFNTASLPDTAGISAAAVKIKQSGSVTGTNPFSILGSLYADIKKGTFGTSASLEKADFNAAATASKVGTFGATSLGGWYTASLSSTGRADVNKTSLTQLRLYFSKATNANNIADLMTFLSGNSASSQAELIITYSLP